MIVLNNCYASIPAISVTYYPLKIEIGLVFVVFVGLLQTKKNSGRLLISATATVGALLLVALMCFWGCYLYKRLGKNDVKGLAVDVSGGADLTPMHEKSY